MRNKMSFSCMFIIGLTVLIASMTTLAFQNDNNKSQNRLESPRDRNSRQVDTLKEEVRHQLVALPYYSVFEWLEADVQPDGTVTLMGQVVRPTTKSDAAFLVKKLESVKTVVDNIEVLPLSTNDDRLRTAVYQAIFQYDSPLFRYATQSVPPIHIVVKNGHVTLKGLVATPMDSHLASTVARQVPGVFDVQNDLQIERIEEKASK